MKSIRRDLTLRLVAACALLWAVCGGGVYLAVRESLEREFDRGLLVKAQALASLLAEHHGKLELNLSEEWMPQFSKGRRADYFQFWRADGRTLERSESLRSKDLPQRAGSPARPELWNLRLPNETRGRAVGIRFVPQGEDDDEPRKTPQPGDAAVTLVVASSRAETEHFLGLLATLLLGSEVVVLVGTATLTTWLVRRGLVPLAIVAERARAIDADAPGTRFPTAGMPAELTPICVRLNYSLTRLEASFVRERQFNSDVAHELRTPIAELRALAEVALKWPDDPAAASHALREALEIAVQMETLVARLLALLRSESGLQAIIPVSTDLPELIERCWRPFAETARQKQLRVSFTIPVEACIHSDPTLLHGIVSNLLSNAAAYTPAGGAVTVRVAAAESAFQLTIDNTTAELTAEDLPHLFERYWRKDAARTTAHSGLGLPLARAYARALGLELEAHLTAPDTFCVVLRPDAARPAQDKSVIE